MQCDHLKRGFPQISTPILNKKTYVTYQNKKWHGFTTRTTARSSSLHCWICHISHLGLLLHGHLPSFKFRFVLVVTMIISNFFSERYISRWQLRCSWFCMMVVLKPIWETLFSILSECEILKSTNYCYVSN